ncbi:MAG: hypothetical protein AAB515_03205 [Patescibacteria group bacterium]
MDGTLHVNDGTVAGGDVAYVYLNDNGRNLNRNVLDNSWNRYCRFVRVRKFLWYPKTLVETRGFLFFIATLVAWVTRLKSV